ncbi:hypothetical protein, partial [Flagellimonas marinaquae]
LIVIGATYNNSAFQHLSQPLLNGARADTRTAVPVRPCHDIAKRLKGDVPAERDERNTKEFVVQSVRIPNILSSTIPSQHIRRGVSPVPSTKDAMKTADTKDRGGEFVVPWEPEKEWRRTTARASTREKENEEYH